MSINNKKYQLSNKQELAVRLKVLGRTGVQIAEEVGVTPETVSRWRHLPEFRARVNQIHQEAEEALIERYRQLRVPGVEALEAALKSGEIPPLDRAKLALRLLESRDLAERAARIGPIDPETLELDDRQRSEINALIRDTMK